MTITDGPLMAAARAAARGAYAPYSGLHVGAAIRAVSGVVYAGCNVENAAFPLGNCAEASAIAAGVQAEGPQLRIAAVAVHAEDRSGQAQAVSPCGGCRQKRDVSQRRPPDSADHEVRVLALVPLAGLLDGREHLLVVGQFPVTALALLSTGDRRAIMSWGAFAAEGAWVWWWKHAIDRRFMGRYRFPDAADVQGSPASND